MESWLVLQESRFKPLGSSLLRTSIKKNRIGLEAPESPFKSTAVQETIPVSLSCYILGEV